MPQEQKLFIRPPSTAGAKPLPEGPAKRPLGQDKLSDAFELLQGFVGLGYDPLEGPEALSQLSDAAKIGSAGAFLPIGRGKRVLTQLLKRVGLKIPEKAAAKSGLTALERTMINRQAPDKGLDLRVYPDPEAMAGMVGHKPTITPIKEQILNPISQEDVTKINASLPAEFQTTPRMREAYNDARKPAESVVTESGRPPIRINRKNPEDEFRRAREAARTKR